MLGHSKHPLINQNQAIKHIQKNLQILHAFPIFLFDNLKTVQLKSKNWYHGWKSFQFSDGYDAHLWKLLAMTLGETKMASNTVTVTSYIRSVMDILIN